MSPSGCTFWGKKPWSRKKKLLWQLGTLVGAPVGIALIAGISIPAMIIGIPVWVGRKIHAKYGQSGKHRRNVAITGGVAASVSTRFYCHHKIYTPVLSAELTWQSYPIQSQSQLTTDGFLGSFHFLETPRCTGSLEFSIILFYTSPPLL